MKQVPQQQDGVTQLPADEFNQIPRELENGITSSDQTLQTSSTADNSQLSKALAQYAGDGDYYTASGGNSINLSPHDSRAKVVAYGSGQRIRFTPVAANSSTTVTVAISGLTSYRAGFDRPADSASCTIPIGYFQVGRVYECEFSQCVNGDPYWQVDVVSLSRVIGGQMTFVVGGTTITLDENGLVYQYGASQFQKYEYNRMRSQDGAKLADVDGGDISCAGGGGISVSGGGGMSVAGGTGINLTGGADVSLVDGGTVTAAGDITSDGNSLVARDSSSNNLYTEVDEHGIRFDGTNSPGSILIRERTAVYNVQPSLTTTSAFQSDTADSHEHTIGSSFIFSTAYDTEIPTGAIVTDVNVFYTGNSTSKKCTAKGSIIFDESGGTFRISQLDIINFGVSGGDVPKTTDPIYVAIKFNGSSL
jgi:hypothetical protein